jgi:general secretion pathway protein F
MAQFSYKSISAAGKVIQGRMEARDEEAVRRQLQSQGFLPIETRPASGAEPVWKRVKRPGGKDLALVIHELAMLLAAGQTVEQALQLLVDGAAPRPLRAPLAAALAELRGGASLTAALAASGCFPPVALAMVQAGEASGALGEQLGRLAAMLERAARLREQLLSALIYPALLVLVAIGAVILLLGLVVPQFAPLFAEAHSALPLSTRAVLGASSLLREQGWTALALVSSLLLGLALALRRPEIAERCDDWLLRLPLIGRLLLLAASGRWMRVLAVLLKGGVPLPEALELVRPVAGHRRLQAMLGAMKNGIKDGKGLTASLPDQPPLPELALPMLRVGEQSGRLDESLFHLAELFDNRLEQSLKRLLAIFEPACVLLLSLMVGTIVISILLAVVSINDLAL